MRPIRTERANATFHLLGGSESSNLSVERTEDEHGTPMLVSTWELTAEERAWISEGGHVELAVWGNGHPPVSLAVTFAEVES